MGLISIQRRLIWKTEIHTYVRSFNDTRGLSASTARLQSIGASALLVEDGTSTNPPSGLFYILQQLQPLLLSSLRHIGGSCCSCVGWGCCESDWRCWAGVVDGSGGFIHGSSVVLDVGVLHYCSRDWKSRQLRKRKISTDSYVKSFLRRFWNLRKHNPFCGAIFSF